MRRTCSCIRVPALIRSVRRHCIGGYCTIPCTYKRMQAAPRPTRQITTANKSPAPFQASLPCADISRAKFAVISTSRKDRC